MRTNLIDYIKDKLDLRKVEKETLEKVPTLIIDAIWELRRNQVIPARVLEFKSIDKKEIKYTPDGEKRYNYYFLPENFGELEEFFVDDGVEEPVKRVPYQYVNWENYIDTANTSGTRKFFTIADIEIDGKNRKILIANPFPKDDSYVQIKYYADGTDDNFQHVEKRYWSQILKEIEGDLGIRSEDSVREHRSIEISRSKNQQGKNKANKTIKSVRPRFFNGTTSRGRRFSRRDY